MTAAALEFDSWWIDDDLWRHSLARTAAASEDLCRQAEGLHQNLDHLERIAASAAQLELALPPMDERARVRTTVADYLERVVLPVGAERALQKLPAKLRQARKSGMFFIRPSDGKTLIRWDDKAGVPLLCPDDAREESQRLQARLVPALEAEVAKGRSLHTAVLTIPNPASGDLVKGVKQLWRRFGKLMRACKRKRSRPFPIVGALAVLEAPLGRNRDWHPHLNLILVCDGYLEYKDLRAWWHWDTHFSRIRGTGDVLRAALNELIKYPVLPMSTKSYEKAHSAHAGENLQSDGAGHLHRSENREADQPCESGCSTRAVRKKVSAAPPMIDWTGVEFLEWWRSHKKHRRTRTYGVLYGLEKPEKEDMSGFVVAAAIKHDGARYRVEVPLLRSIPGDNSTTANPVERWKRWLKPPNIAAAGRFLVENGRRIIGTSEV